VDRTYYDEALKAPFAHVLAEWVQSVSESPDANLSKIDPFKSIQSDSELDSSYSIHNSLNPSEDFWCSAEYPGECYVTIKLTRRVLLGGIDLDFRTLRFRCVLVFRCSLRR